MVTTVTVANNEIAKKRMMRRLIFVFILVIVGLTFFSNTLVNLSLPQVTVAQPASGTLLHEVTGSGTVEAAETEDLYINTNWAASDVKIKVGDKVEAGQELITFQTEAAEDSLKDNQARYEQKQLNLQKLQDNYAETIRGGIEKQMRGISRDIENAKLDMQIAERQIANQQRQLADFSRLTSPVSGIVTEVNTVKGASVQSGKAAVRIADLTKGQQLKAEIDAAKVQYMNVGDETEMLFVTLANARIKAKITDIRDAVSGSSGGTAQSGQERKGISFTLQDDRLKGGETGKFDIIKRTTPLRLLLSNDAIRVDDNGKYVFILKEKKGPLGNEYVLQRASVQVGDADDNKTSVENGITPLDKVVVSSNKPVSVGDRVLKAD